MRDIVEFRKVNQGSFSYAIGVIYGLISCLLCTKIYNVGRDDL